MRTENGAAHVITGAYGRREHVWTCDRRAEASGIAWASQSTGAMRYSLLENLAQPHRRRPHEGVALGGDLAHSVGTGLACVRVGRAVEDGALI